MLSPDVMQDPLFFNISISPEQIQQLFIETCELERKKAADKIKKQKAVSAAAEVHTFTENIDLSCYPTLVSKQILPYDR